MRKPTTLVIAAALAGLLMSGCAPEPRVLIVPDEGSPLDSGIDIAADPSFFEQDVEILREEIVPGQVWETSRYWLVSELKNTSQATVYSFQVSIDAFDAEGKVRAANITSPVIHIGPGETVLFLERLGENLFDTIPSTVETVYQARSARAVTEDDVQSLSVDNLDWSFSTDYFGDREFVISGTVTNNSPKNISSFRVDAWCGNQSGQLFAMPSQAFFGGDGVLAPGSSIPFVTDMYTEIDMTIDECKATVVHAAPTEYGPGVTVNELRDSSAEKDLAP